MGSSLMAEIVSPLKREIKDESDRSLMFAPFHGIPSSVATTAKREA